MSERFEAFTEDELDVLASSLYRYLNDLEEGNRYTWEREAPLIQALADEVDETL